VGDTLPSHAPTAPGPLVHEWIEKTGGAENVLVWSTFSRKPRSRACGTTRRTVKRTRSSASLRSRARRFVAAGLWRCRWCRRFWHGTWLANSHVFAHQAASNPHL